MAIGKAFCPLACAIAATIGVGAGACAGDRRIDPAFSAYRFPVREYTLPSGLRVVIEQDDTTPIAGVVCVVEAGHLDDPPGKSHLAHTLEHLIINAPINGGASLYTVMRRLGAVGYRPTTDAGQTTYPAFVSLTSLDELVSVL